MLQGCYGALPTSQLLRNPIKLAKLAPNPSIPSNYRILNSNSVTASSKEIQPRGRSGSSSRNPDHAPRTASPQDEPLYVLSLRTDRPFHDKITALRTAHFPPHLNKLEAHIALFHALPGSWLARIEQDIAHVAGPTASFSLSTGRAFALARGLAIAVDKGAEELEETFARLKSSPDWDAFLSKQDRAAKLKPHFTVQNKVEDRDVVRKTLGAVQNTLDTAQGGGFRGTAEGLSLWLYDRGWWRWRRDWEFCRGGVGG